MVWVPPRVPAIGDWRWGRIRTVVGCLKAARKAFAEIIPWNERTVTYMMDNLEEAAAPPGNRHCASCRPLTLWGRGWACWR